MKEYKHINCPKCKGNNITSESSHGGFNYYKNLKCLDCGYKGKTSVDYINEEERVEREIVERFLNKDNEPDAVVETLRSHGVI